MPILVPSVSLSTANRKLLATVTPGLASAYNLAVPIAVAATSAFPSWTIRKPSVVADTRFSSLYAGTCLVTIASCSDPLWITIIDSARSGVYANAEIAKSYLPSVTLLNTAANSSGTIFNSTPSLSAMYFAISISLPTYCSSPLLEESINSFGAK